MSRKEWRASSNGPDTLDVTAMMSAIGTLHSGHVALIVSPAENGSATTVDLAMSILLDVLPGSALPSNIAAHATWPNANGTSFWGEAYRLCWILDEEISKVYQNGRLWE